MEEQLEQKVKKGYRFKLVFFAEELTSILNQKRNFTSLNIDLLWDFPCI